jgi:Uma2 family endonuclease
VREYWVIHPHTRAVSVYLLENGRFAPAKEYPAGQDVPAAVLPGFTWCCPG